MKRFEGKTALITGAGSGIGRAVSLRLVGDASACRKVVEEVATIAGQLDVLCNIAGIALCQNFSEISDADWQRVILGRPHWPGL